MLRIFLLLLLTQCGSAQLQQLLQNEQPRAVYSKYVPGINSGVGINFSFEFKNAYPDIEVDSLLINGEKVQVDISSRDPLILSANKFYSNEGEEKGPSPSDMPLYTATSYEAVISFRNRGESFSLKVSDFEKGETQYYP